MAADAIKLGANDDLEDLRLSWKEMFQKKLPDAATSKSPVQPKWPVHVDHCFARIILDVIVGIDTPWMDKIPPPAYKNMTKQQLEDSISLGEHILSGEADLQKLNTTSLSLRGQSSGGGPTTTAAHKRKEPHEHQSPPAKKARPADKSTIYPQPQSPPGPTTAPEKDALLAKIAHSKSSPFQKRVLSALLQVPTGHYTTYGMLAKHLNSSARAVGSGLRNNPFAPDVPCHRVLAAGGGIGGFKGSWGRNGKEGLNDGEKRSLLRREGVKFDGLGRVVGRPWDRFQ